MKRIGIFVERQRAWGRQLCEGVASFAQERADWELTTLEREDLASQRLLATFDGFIARVYDETVAEAFCRAEKPVADVSCERTRPAPFFRGVLQNNRDIGILAARHFIEHRFVNFAFCGFDGKRFSDARRDAFVRCLRLNHFDCLLYRSPVRAAAELDRSIARRERLAASTDNARLQAWLAKLPRPVAVFCANDLRALHVLEACKSCGLKVPDDVAILGVDNDTLVCNFTSPTLSSIDPDARRLGYSAARMLNAMMERQPSNPSHRAFLSPTKGLVERESTEFVPLVPKWLSDALVFIGKNYSRGISASDVFKLSGRSATYVERIFRKHLSMSVHGYISKVRIDEAMRLLKTTDLMIKEIGERCGYSATPYFCRAFADHTGKTPSDIRRENR